MEYRRAKTMTTLIALYFRLGLVIGFNGPVFTEQPVSVLSLGNTPPNITFECSASGKPNPQIKWYLSNKNAKLQEIYNSRRHSVANGKLIIREPEQAIDHGTYRCVAENMVGKIMANPAKLNFGHLGEFSSMESPPVAAFAFEGALIECDPIEFRPALTYTWFKGRHFPQYIDTRLAHHMFVSANGRLYFSEVTATDDNKYFCAVKLTSFDTSGVVIGTDTAPHRVSKGTDMRVLDKPGKAEWGPIIHDDFIAVYPNPPIIGQDVRLECFAYGSPRGVHYMWKKDGVDIGITGRVKAVDHNRVLVIPSSLTTDEGTYTCSVTRGRKSDSKSYTLQLESKPEFTIQLHNRLVNKGEKLNWRCVAKGIPTPTYTWYKNAQILTSSSGITVANNVLSIDSLDVMHKGMYQCGASNKHGTAFSSAQLKVDNGQ